MSHFTVLVITSETEIGNRSGEELVVDLLVPYSENGKWNREGSKWDWYAIGGRWEGSLGTYEPDQDMRNYSKCNQCHGTGLRDDKLGKEHRAKDPDYGCNGCVMSIEKGKTLKLPNGESRSGWSRNWSNAPTDENVKLVRDIRDDFRPFAYVTPDNGWVESGKMGWFGSSSGENDSYDSEWEQAVEQYTDRVAVLVDCHV